MSKTMMIAYLILIIWSVMANYHSKRSVHDFFVFISVVSGIGVFIWFLWSVFEVVFS